MMQEKYLFLYEEITKHLQRLERAFTNLNNTLGLPLTAEKVEKILSDDILSSFLDQIAYRFSKIQDSLGKLIRSYLFLKGENVENLTMIDVLNYAEKYNLKINKEKWFELRELRNAITHEYGRELSKIAETINKIYEEIEYLRNIVESLK
jgi:uncharacterized protein with HEPN domain